MNRKHIYAVVSVLLAHLSLLIIFAAFRSSLFDEGVYMNAARLVGEGKEIYKDFFFPQLMYLPMITSGLAQDGWTSFWMLRGLSVLAGFVSALLVYAITLKLSRNRIAALTSLAVYSFSGIILSWHSIFTSQVFAHLLSLSCLYFWMLYFKRKSIFVLLLMTACLAVLINMRATFMVLVPVYLISVLMISGDKRIKSILAFLAMMTLCSLPAIFIMMSSPNKFFFDVFSFQLIRESNRALDYIIMNKLTTIIRLLIDPHYFLIIGMSAVGVFVAIKSKVVGAIRDLFCSPEGMVLMNFVIIAIVYFIPHPMMRQYAEQYLAFAIIIGSLAIPYIIDQSRNLKSYAVKFIVVTAAIILYTGSLLPYMAIYLFGQRQSELMYSLAEIRKVTGKIIECGDENSIVLSEWAGYPFLVRQSQLGRTEILGWEWTFPNRPDVHARYCLADFEYLRNSVIKKDANVIVTVSKTPEAYADVILDNYNLELNSAGVSVYCLK